MRRKRTVGTALAVIATLGLTTLVGTSAAAASPRPADRSAVVPNDVPGASCHLSYNPILSIYWSACDYTPIDAVHWVAVHCVGPGGGWAYDTGAFHPAGSTKTTYSSGFATDICLFGWDQAHYSVAPA